MPVLVALTLISLGIVLANFRAVQVAAPVLEFRFYGAIEGDIVAIDRSGSDKLRLTLADVVLERVPPARTPRNMCGSLCMATNRSLTQARVCELC